MTSGFSIPSGDRVAPVAPPHPQRVVLEGRPRGSWEFCFAAGVVFMIAGLFFLIVAPGETVPTLNDLGLPGVPQTVVNLQRLAMGETFTITGAVFLAAALRPRG